MCSRTVSGRFFQWFQTNEYIRNFISRYAWMRAHSLLLISGAFACFRREAVLTVGGFDPDCLVEDYELIHRLHRHAHDAGLHWTVRVVGGALARTMLFEHRIDAAVTQRVEQKIGGVERIAQQ